MHMERRGRSPLTSAVAAGNVELVKFYLDHADNINLWECKANVFAVANLDQTILDLLTDVSLFLIDQCLISSLKVHPNVCAEYP